jgi:hypothetical protein
MTLNSAIIKLNQNIVYMVGDVAYDVDENIVEYDIEAAKKLVEDEKYKELRQLEYPPVTDYIDGVVKGDQAQIDAYIAACQAVKAKYPKPEGNV